MGPTEMEIFLHISEKAELTALVHHIERFSKSGLRIYNFEVPDTAGRKRRRSKHSTDLQFYLPRPRFSDKKNISLLKHS